MHPGLAAGTRQRLRIPPAVAIVTLMIRPSQPVATSLMAGLGAVVRPRTRIGRVAQQLLRTAAGAGVAGLVAFHGWLLWDRLAGGDLLDPGVAFRWSVAALLVLALAGLQRAGAPLVRGRRALVVWLLVALLHWSTGTTAAPTAALTSSPASVIFVLPTTGAAALMGLGLLAALIAARRRTTPVFRCLCTLEPIVIARPAVGWRDGGASRAPPSAFA